MSFSPSDSKAPFLPTSQVYPEDESQRLIVHTEKYTSIAHAVNVREIGTFELIEQLNGQQFFNTTNTAKKRFAYRKAFSFGAIAAGTTLSIPHGIIGANTTTTFIHIYGTARTDMIDNRPLPYVNVPPNRAIELRVDTTNILIEVAGSSPAVISGIVVLEFLKN